MGIFETFKGSELKKEEITSEDLIMYGGFKNITEALTTIHPLIKMSYSGEEILDLLNKAEITRDELKEISEIRNFKKGEDKLDYENRFYDIRSRLDSAISKIEGKVA